MPPKAPAKPAAAESGAPAADTGDHNVTFTMRVQGSQVERREGPAKLYFTVDPSGKKVEKSEIIGTATFDSTLPPFSAMVTLELATALLKRPLLISLYQQPEKKGADVLVGQCQIDLTPLALGDTKQLVYRYGMDAPDPAPPGLNSLVLTLECAEPLLSAIQRQKLNPLIITIHSVKNLPMDGRTPEQLRSQYRPVVCRYRFFGLDAPVETPALPHAPSLRIGHSTMLMTGEMDIADLSLYLLQAKLVVELRDREKPLPAEPVKSEPPAAAPAAEAKKPAAAGAASSSAAKPAAGGGGAGKKKTESEPPAPEPAVPQGPPPDPDFGLQTDPDLDHEGRVMERPHGLATFSLAELVTRRCRSLHLTANVLPTRTPHPHILPAGYVEAGCEMKISVRLLAPLPPAPPAHLHRIVLMCKYDHPVAEQVASLVTDTNAAALGLSVQLATSHRLTPEQAADASLDLFTGFEVIDSGRRLYVLEGLAEKGMTRIDALIPRSVGNSADFTVLRNADLRFHKRLYTAFDADLRRLRLRVPLDRLSSSKSTFKRAELAPECYHAILKLMELRSCSALLDAVSRDAFPSVAMLLALDKKYGESPTVSDMRGLPEGMSPGRALRTAVGAALAPVLFETEPVDKEPKMRTIAEKQGLMDIPELRTTLDHHNPFYDKVLAERETAPPRDYVRENRARFPTPPAAPRMLMTDEGAENIFIYSTQRLNTIEIQRRAMIERLSQEKDKVFTYSRDFASQSFPLGDPETAQKQELSESKRRFMTERGFVYPAPRPPQAFHAHPKKPSKSRIDELRLPWVEGEMQGKPPQRDARPPPGKPRFVTTAHVPPTFSSADFFKSVHIGGAGRAREEQELLEREFEAWRSKLVVDSPSFRVDWRSTQRATVHPTDRNATMLADPPRRPGLLPRVGPPAPIPTSVFLDTPYEGATQGTIQREADKTRFMEKDRRGFITAVGGPATSLLRLHHDTLSRRPIPPVTVEEKRSSGLYRTIREE